MSCLTTVHAKSVVTWTLSLLHQQAGSFQLHGLQDSLFRQLGAKDFTRELVRLFLICWDRTRRCLPWICWWRQTVNLMCTGRDGADATSATWVAHAGYEHRCPTSSETMWVSWSSWICWCCRRWCIRLFSSPSKAISTASTQKVRSSVMFTLGGKVHRCGNPTDKNQGSSIRKKSNTKKTRTHAMCSSASKTKVKQENSET